MFVNKLEELKLKINHRVLITVLILASKARPAIFNPDQSDIRESN